MSSYLALFGAGVASFLAPCVVPLVPAYVGMLSGQLDAPPGRLMRESVLFVGGFTTVFVSIGVLAGRLGSLDSVQALLRRVGGLLVVALGVLMLAGLRGRGPQARHLFRVERVSGRLRAVVLGVTFGAAWTPCVGPLLGTALVAAAGSGAPWRGAALLGAYSLGIGAPFVLVALTVVASPGHMRRIARWSSRLALASAVSLVGLGALLALDHYDTVVSPLAERLSISLPSLLLA